MKISTFYQWGTQFVGNLPLAAGSNVLDIGCRDGAVSAYLADKYQLQVTAIDKNPHHIEIARHYHREHVEYETLDVSELACTTHYDAIISFNALLWVQNKILAFQNMYEALKPGKKAHLLFFAFHGHPKNDQVFYQTARQSDWKAYFHKFTPDYYETTISEVGRILQQQGFLIHRLEMKRYDTLFEHPEALLHFFETWGSHHKRLPPSKKRSFLADATKNYLDNHCYNSKEPFPYHEYLLEVDCEKPCSSLPKDKNQVYEFNEIIFTPQEARVLKHYLQGKSAKEIARDTSISAKTVEFHIGKIKGKLNCSLRSDVFKKAQDIGFLQLIYNPFL